MILIFTTLVVVTIIVILFFREKRITIKIILSLILIFSIFFAYISNERELDNKNTTFEIKYFSLNDYYSNYVFNFKGDFNQIKSIFNYVHNDLKERKIKKEKLAQIHIKSERNEQGESAKELVLINSMTEEEIESSFVDYEFLRPVSGANPYDQKNIIFKFSINQDTGEITHIVNRFTNEPINEMKLITINDSITIMSIEKVNYESFSKCLKVIQADSKNLKLKSHCYKIYNNNNFSFKVKFYGRRSLKLFFDDEDS